VAAESNTIRIGNQNIQKATYIAGIFGSSATGDAVVISNTGKLGIVVSSARYKRDIRDMGDASDALIKLRPVTFRYKDDPSGPRQYGLVAEEVARVYPDLVSRDAAGKVVTVHYHELIPMLLNELQHQELELRAQARQNNAELRRLDTQSQQLAELKAQNESLRAAAGQAECVTGGSAGLVGQAKNTRGHWAADDLN